MRKIVFKKILQSGRKVAMVLLLFIGIIITSLSCSPAPTKSMIMRQKAIENSPQWQEGQFKNSLKRVDGSLWKMLGSYISNDAEFTVPDRPVPTVNREKKDFSQLPENGLRVTWLGHSSTLVEIDGYRILIDPVWEKRVSPISWMGPKRFFAPPLSLNDLPELDVVLISHDHFDHLDKKTIEALKDRVPLFAVPLGVGAHLEAWGIDPARITECDWWDELKLGKLTLTATPGRHFSGRSLISMFANKTLWAGWSMVGPEHRVYYSGDTAMFPGFTEIGDRLGPFDLTLIEVGAYNRLWTDVHLGPEQAVQAHQMVRGKLMMPVHWGTFDLALHNWTEPAERLIVAAGDSGSSLVFPKPGESIDPKTVPMMTRWWPELPWQKAEDAPIVSTGLNNKTLTGITENQMFQDEKPLQTHPL